EQSLARYYDDSKCKHAHSGEAEILQQLAKSDAEFTHAAAPPSDRARRRAARAANSSELPRPPAATMRWRESTDPSVSRRREDSKQDDLPPGTPSDQSPRRAKPD